jgi:hypothetical protein
MAENEVMMERIILHFAEVETFPDQVTFSKLCNTKWWSYLKPGKKECKRKRRHKHPQ